MTTTDAALAAALPFRQRVLITVGITIAAMVTLLDTAIVSVALSHMQGGLSVDQDQISWVVTAYLVVLAVMTPPTGWLASYFGRKPLFLVSVSIFALASLLCGLSDTLGQIIALRIVQAFFGAFLVPLTQAAVLTVSSYPTRTSIPVRGKWVLENLLGSPPPPPPPDAPQLDESQVGETVSQRERLEQHRSDPNCSSCHMLTDPIGFGLESYDAIGAWRTHDGAAKIDTSGVLPDGQSFRGARELTARAE